MYKTINSIQSMLQNWNGKWGIYPNLATNDFDNEYSTLIDKSDFKNSIFKLCDFKPNVIGLCCGSTPENIIELTKLINERKKYED